MPALGRLVDAAQVLLHGIGLLVRRAPQRGLLQVGLHGDRALGGLDLDLAGAGVGLEVGAQLQDARAIFVHAIQIDLELHLGEQLAVELRQAFQVQRWRLSRQALDGLVEALGQGLERFLFLWRQVAFDLDLHGDARARGALLALVGDGDAHRGAGLGFDGQVRAGAGAGFDGPEDIGGLALDLVGRIGRAHVHDGLPVAGAIAGHLLQQGRAQAGKAALLRPGAGIAAQDLVHGGVGRPFPHLHLARAGQRLHERLVGHVHCFKNSGQLRHMQEAVATRCGGGDGRGRGCRRTGGAGTGLGRRCGIGDLRAGGG